MRLFKLPRSLDNLFPCILPVHLPRIQIFFLLLKRRYIAGSNLLRFFYSKPETTVQPPSLYSIMAGLVLVGIIGCYLILPFEARAAGNDVFSSGNNSGRPWRDIPSRYPDCTGLVHEYWSMTNELNALAEQRRHTVDPQSRQIGEEINKLAAQRNKVGKQIQDCIRESKTIGRKTPEKTHPSKESSKHLLLKGKIEKKAELPPYLKPQGDSSDKKQNPPRLLGRNLPPEEPRYPLIPLNPPTPSHTDPPQPGHGPQGRVSQPPEKGILQGKAETIGNGNEDASKNTNDRGNVDSDALPGENDPDDQTEDDTRKECEETEPRNHEERICNLRKLAQLVDERYNTGSPIAIYRVTNRGPNTFLVTLAGTELMKVYQVNNVLEAVRSYVAGLVNDPHDPYLKTIVSALEILPDGSNLILTGHSLGGMEALHVSSHLQGADNHKAFGIDQVITFGSPITHSPEVITARGLTFVEVKGDPIPSASLVPHSSIRVQGVPMGSWMQHHAHYKDSAELEDYDVFGEKNGNKKFIDVDVTSLRTFEGPLFGGRAPPRGSSENPYLCSGIAQNARNLADSFLELPQIGEIRLGPNIGHGKFGEVYQIPSQQGFREHGWLIKIFNDHEKVLEAAENQVQASDILIELGIITPEIRIVHLDASKNCNFLIIKDIHSFTGGELFDELPPEHQEQRHQALKKLYDYFAKKGFIAQDLHGENVFFYQENGNLKAGVIEGDPLYQASDFKEQSERVQLQLFGYLQQEQKVELLFEKSLNAREIMNALFDHWYPEK